MNDCSSNCSCYGCACVPFGYQYTDSSQNYWFLLCDEGTGGNSSSLTNNTTYYLSNQGLSTSSPTQDSNGDSPPFIKFSTSQSGGDGQYYFNITIENISTSTSQPTSANDYSDVFFVYVTSAYPSSEGDVYQLTFYSTNSAYYINMWFYYCGPSGGNVCGTTVTTNSFVSNYSSLDYFFNIYSTCGNKGGNNFAWTELLLSGTVFPGNVTSTTKPSGISNPPCALFPSDFNCYCIINSTNCSSQCSNT